MLRGGTIARWFAPFAIVFALLRVSPAFAEDRIGELSKLVSTSSNDKTRLAAVAALGRLEDRRAMKPLVSALADPSPQVRAVAAAALGKLGHKAALPSLKAVAIDDTDADVRKRAKDAAIAVARTNALPHPWPATVASVPAKAPRKSRPGFGNQPRVLAQQADLCVLIN
jgi:HEAT repeat protein